MGIDAELSAMTMCGYRCDLCKADIGNIRKKDERDVISQVWRKYYDLDIAKGDIYCDGCRCTRKDAKRIDNNCPVRACVLSRGLSSCADCKAYPCKTFFERKGLSIEEAKERLASDFNREEYMAYLSAFDNYTRINKIIEERN
ncbi:MAG: DUF3795 domain-containing protein [Vallitaleaceae bacterium]|jgi:hypothetical protein|nr:DUF3795 domain-containing protein [Vallitaleaceae bacterium]